MWDKYYGDWKIKANFDTFFIYYEKEYSLQ